MISSSVHDPCDPPAAEEVAADARMSNNIVKPVGTFLSDRPRINNFHSQRTGEKVDQFCIIRIM